MILHPFHQPAKVTFELMRLFLCSRIRGIKLIMLTDAGCTPKLFSFWAYVVAPGSRSPSKDKAGHSATDGLTTYAYFSTSFCTRMDHMAMLPHCCTLSLSLSGRTNNN